MLKSRFPPWGIPSQKALLQALPSNQARRCVLDTCSSFLSSHSALGFNDTTWRHAGDAVAIDDIVLQIETDKGTVAVRYTTGKPGKLKEMLVKEEDTVAVGQEVASVTEGEEGSEPDKKEVCCHTMLEVKSRQTCQMTLHLQSMAYLVCAPD